MVVFMFAAWVITLKSPKPVDKIAEATPAVPIQYFDGTPMLIGVEESDGADALEVNRALAAFLAMEPKDRESASGYVFENYQKAIDAGGEGDGEIALSAPEQIWSLVHPTEIVVSRRNYGDRGIYVQILAECDWDTEHGLQIVYRNGNQLSRVSDQDGHLTYSDAYGVPDDQDRII